MFTIRLALSSQMAKKTKKREIIIEWKEEEDEKLTIQQERKLFTACPMYKNVYI